ncbi:MAG: hypothetical protein NC311_05050 [Muribaculaceae bacterium]|nr:hypothetical protein [Muribaculaceae bacterium]
MSSERESLPILQNNTSNGGAGALTPVDYDIAGNSFRIYYDAEGTPVFVLDGTQSARKPNVMLVIPATDNRKWDEILSVDWGVDLETVRPRKDNKYQKLDIEYNNLDAYLELVDAYETNSDMADALANLDAFRVAAVRRVALERLDMALDTAERARETIEKTTDTINGLNVRVKELRAKLNQQKKSIGKEPTKQSASKILRSDAQIDATNEKISRAQRRLTNAQRRLVAAEDDASAAQALLDITDSVVVAPHHGVGRPAPHDVIPVTSPPVPVIADTEQTKIITEPKAEIMAAEEDVKPLFDTDPEILDEEIAFKPIDFGVSSTPVAPAPDMTTDGRENAETDVAPAPLSFVPPVAPDVMPNNDFAPISGVPDVPSAPVLDSMRPVDVNPQPAPSYQPTPQPAPYVDNRAFAAAAADAPIVQQPVQNPVPYSDVSPVAAAPAYQPKPAPIPDVSVAPNASGFRPVSPIRGNTVASGGVQPQKSKFLYYVMLVMLIVLSVFTLWLYQRSTSQNIPELAATTSGGASDNDVASQGDNPFIGANTESEKVAPVVVSEPVVEPEPEPIVEPEPVAEPEPVVDVPEPMPDPEPVPTVAEPEPVSEPEPVPETSVEVENPFLTPAVEKTDIKPIITDALINKPIYNVSQHENMFIAAPDYETDARDDAATNVYYTDDTTVVTESADVCSDGALPDANGCCAGEVFTDMEDGTFACCQPYEDGECFAPMR